MRMTRDCGSPCSCIERRIWLEQTQEGTSTNGRKEEQMTGGVHKPGFWEFNQKMVIVRTCLSWLC